MDADNENQLKKGKAIGLKDFIEYSEGSIVSKILLERKTGNLTLFSFDENQALSEHSVPFDAVVQILDGGAELTIGGELVKVYSGQIAIMPANVPHSVKAITRFKMLLTMIRT